MARRMIDDSWLNNPEFQRLSGDDRQFCFGLVTAADDIGRGPADPRWVRSKACPFSDDTNADVTGRLERVAAALTNPNLFPGRLLLYEVAGVRYWQWQDWAMFQRLENPEPDGHPDPPGYAWVPDTTDRRRKGRAGRWEPAESSTANSHGSADLPAKVEPPVPSGGQAQGAVPAGRGEEKQEPPKAEPTVSIYPDGYHQICQCHQQHSTRPVSTDDTKQLLQVMREAAEAGVEWQTLLTLMREAQARFKEQKPGQVIKFMGYYCRVWREYIEAAVREGRKYGQPDEPPEQPPDDNDSANIYAARAREQAAALLRGDARVTAS